MVEIISKSTIKKIAYWVFVAFLVYIAIELVRRLLGGSLGFEELVVGLLITNLGYSFYINSKLSEHIGWHVGKSNKR